MILYSTLHDCFIGAGVGEVTQEGVDEWIVMHIHNNTQQIVSDEHDYGDVP